MNEAFTATIYTSNRCNLKCPYCYVDYEKEEINTKENIFKYINLLFTDPFTKDREHMTLDFIGGEPFIELELMSYAIDTFRELADKYNKWNTCDTVTFFTTSNGTLLLTEKVQEFLKKYPFFYYGISMDGPKEIHDKNRRYKDDNGSFDDVIEAFKWTNRNKFCLDNVKTTVAQNNADKLLDIAKLQINELKSRDVMCSIAFGEEWTESDVGNLRKSYSDIFDYLINMNLEFVKSLSKGIKDIEMIKNSKKQNIKQDYQCGSGKYMACLDVYGNIYPCHMFMHKAKTLTIGHVDSGFDSDKINRLVDKFKESYCDDGCILSENCVRCIGNLYDKENDTFKKPLDMCRVGKLFMENTYTIINKIVDNVNKTVTFTRRNS